ncbi:MAG: metal ABC transporter permease [Chitinivibrionales bacterium]|nr:metal ABC transporter permease [Chitinivibrionales bacterium]MBD3397085.1 metal ABC transporter permease [Chitinivibrionales bacterium]
MMQFFTDLFRYPFLQYALMAALLSSVASGVVGSLVVVRRSTYVAGAIAHCVLGGMGVARFASTVYGVTWLTPMVGAFIAAFIAACVIAWATVYVKERLDSVLSIVWALGMAIGITFIMKTPGYAQDLMSYLFGSILMVSPTDLMLMLVLDAVILAGVLLFYNRILAVCFHEEAALARGIPVGLYTFLILIFTAITTVLLSQIVGIVMVIALLSIPAATVSRFTRRLSTMMIAATGLSMALSLGGLCISYGPELPVGATIIELAGLCYLAAILASAGPKRRRR